MTNNNILAAFEAELTKVAEQHMDQQRPAQSRTEEAADKAKATAINTGVDIAKATARDVMKKRRGTIINRTMDRLKGAKDYVTGKDNRPQGMAGVLRAAGDSAMKATSAAAGRAARKAAK